MTRPSSTKSVLALIAAALALAVHDPLPALAHCDTMDGPVIQDARKAIEARDVTPVLKWVKAKDEKRVKAAFAKAVAAKGAGKEASQRQFFEALVKIHRAGEGAPFTGLKPAGEVEPAVAEADRALAAGSADALVKMVTGDVETGIRRRFDRVAEAYKHKDESVAEGREFVEAYVDYTHYVERLHEDASGTGGHGEHKESAGNARRQHNKGATPGHQGHEH